jgi:hypothetical protein
MYDVKDVKKGIFTNVKLCFLFNVQFLHLDPDPANHLNAIPCRFGSATLDGALHTAQHVLIISKG